MKYRDLITNEIIEAPVYSGNITGVRGDKEVIARSVETKTGSWTTEVIGKYLNPGQYTDFPPITRVLIQEGLLKPGYLCHGWISTPYTEDMCYFEIDSEEIKTGRSYYLKSYIVDATYKKVDNDWVCVFKNGDMI